MTSTAVVTGSGNSSAAPIGLDRMKGLIVLRPFMGAKPSKEESSIRQKAKNGSQHSL